MRQLFLLIFIPFSLSATLKEQFLPILEHIPGFELSTTTVEPLPDGATNENFVVTTTEGQYFMRCGSEEAERMGANLEQEYLCTLVAAKEKMAPEVVLFLPEENAMVSRYIEPCRQVNPYDKELISRLVAHVKHLHELPVHFERKFCPFEKIRYYRNLAKEHSVKFPNFVTDVLLPAVDEIEKRIGKPKKLCPCHLDLHRKNLIDDGKHLWIVDWEFSAMADPYFDIATFAAISLYGDEEMAFFLDAYLDGANPADLAYFDLMRIVTDTHWTLWNLIQNEISPHDAPYDLFAAEFYDDALPRIQRRAYKKHLDLIR